jgi:hypothetical protein
MSGIHKSKPRILKVEEVGDFWRKRTFPRIRLKGKWLTQAGILPTRYVSVTSPLPGVLVLQVVDSNE